MLSSVPLTRWFELTGSRPKPSGAVLTSSSREQGDTLQLWQKTWAMR